MLWVGRDLKDLVLIPCHGQGRLPLDRVARSPSRLVLNSSMDGSSTGSLGNLDVVINAYCYH